MPVDPLDDDLFALDSDDDIFALDSDADDDVAQVELMPDGGANLHTLPTISLSKRAMAKDIAAELGPTADPMRFMLETVADINRPFSLRLDAAKASAQFLYPKLAATAVSEMGKMSVEDLLTGLPDPDE